MEYLTTSTPLPHLHPRSLDSTMYLCAQLSFVIICLLLQRVRGSEWGVVPQATVRWLDQSLEG